MEEVVRMGYFWKGPWIVGLETSWEQNVIVKPRKTVLGTVVEHKEHLTGETDNAALRAPSLLLFSLYVLSNS